MKGHAPISDSGLLLGSVFVAVAIVGIGILGGQSGPETMAQVPMQAMTAAAGDTVSPATAAYCRTSATTFDSEIKEPCMPGCYYNVVVSGGVPHVYVVGGPNPPPTPTATSGGTPAYNTGNLPPGQVTYVGTTGALSQPLQCGARGTTSLQQVVGQAGTAGTSVSGTANTTGVTTVSSGKYTNLPTQPGTTYSVSGGAPGEVVSYVQGVNGQPGSYQFYIPSSVGGSQVPGPGEIAADPGFNGNDAQALQQGTFDTWGPGTTPAPTVVGGAPAASVPSPSLTAQWAQLNPSMDTQSVGDITSGASQPSTMAGTPLNPATPPDYNTPNQPTVTAPQPSTMAGTTQSPAVPPDYYPQTQAPISPSPVAKFVPNAENCGFLTLAGWTSKCYGWRATPLEPQT